MTDQPETYWADGTTVPPLPSEAYEAIVALVCRTNEVFTNWTNTHADLGLQTQVYGAIQVMADLGGWMLQYCAQPGDERALATEVLNLLKALLEKEVREIEGHGAADADA